MKNKENSENKTPEKIISDSDSALRGNGHNEFLHKCEVVIDATSELAQKKAALKKIIAELKGEEGMRVLRAIQERLIRGEIPTEVLIILSGREFFDRSDYVKVGLSFRAALEKIPEKIQKGLGITSRVVGFNADKILQALIARGEDKAARDFQASWPEVWRNHQASGENNNLARPPINPVKESIPLKET